MRIREVREFTVAKAIYLNLRQAHLKALLQVQVTKLSPKFYGPYTIVFRLGKETYKLQLPEGSQIQLDFHISLLKKLAKSNPMSSTLPL